jgi:hypothetical protein
MKASKKMRFGLSILLSVVLIRCAGNVGKAYSLDETEGKGVAVVSLTRSGFSGSSMFVLLRGVDNDYRQKVPVTDLFASRDFGKARLFGDIPEDKPSGRLAIIELPEGEYEFYSFSGSHMYAIRQFSKRFRVIAGQAIYLGNMHFSLERGSYNIKITDMCDRDLPLLYQKNPNITADKVSVDLLQ